MGENERWMYVVEEWNNEDRTWRPHRIGENCSLDKAGETLELFQSINPDKEYRLNQLSLQDYSYMRSFG